MVILQRSTNESELPHWNVPKGFSQNVSWERSANELWTIQSNIPRRLPGNALGAFGYDKVLKRFPGNVSWERSANELLTIQSNIPRRLPGNALGTYGYDKVLKGFPGNVTWNVLRTNRKLSWITILEGSVGTFHNVRGGTLYYVPRTLFCLLGNYVSK